MIEVNGVSYAGADRESDGFGGTIGRHWPIQPRQSMAIFRFLKIEEDFFQA